MYLLVRDTQNIRGGGIVISCANAADTMKVKQLFDKNDQNEYDVHLPEIKKPRVKIMNVDGDMSPDDIVFDVVNKNDSLHYANFVIKKILKNENNNSQDIVAEVYGGTFDVMMNLRKIFVGWNRCIVMEHVYLRRCFKCCGFRICRQTANITWHVPNVQGLIRQLIVMRDRFIA